MDDNRVKFLCNVKTAMEAEQVIELLEQNGIVASSKNGLMYIYGGNNAISDAEIFVNEEEYIKAKELIDQYQPIRPYTQKGRTADAYRLMPKAFAIGLLAIVMAFILIGMVILICGVI